MLCARGSAGQELGSSTKLTIGPQPAIKKQDFDGVAILGEADSKVLIAGEKCSRGFPVSIFLKTGFRIAGDGSTRTAGRRQSVMHGETGVPAAANLPPAYRELTGAHLCTQIREQL